MANISYEYPDYEMPYEVACLFEKYLPYIYIDHNNNKRLAKHSVLSWNESASREAGTFCYTLDNELVFVTTQECYKCEMKFYWVSKEAYNKVKKFFISMIYDNVDFDDDINLIDYTMPLMEER